MLLTSTSFGLCNTAGYHKEAIPICKSNIDNNIEINETLYRKIMIEQHEVLVYTLRVLTIRKICLILFRNLPVTSPLCVDHTMRGLTMVC